MGISIKEATWETVKNFWQENEHLKSEVQPIQLQNVMIFTVLDSFKYQSDEVIAALGKMAVAQKYRKNGIANALLKISCFYMNQGVFDISVLWASILKLYEKFGYVAIHKNMMVKYLTSCDVSIENLRKIPDKIGAW